MKNILTKLSYMALGGFLTLIGYHFGNIENNTADAQVEQSESFHGKPLHPIVIQDVIRCRKLFILDEEGVHKRRIILSANGIEILNEDQQTRVLLGIADNIDSGSLMIAGASGHPTVKIGTFQNTDTGRVIGGGVRIFEYDPDPDPVVIDGLPVVDLQAGQDGGLLKIYNNRLKSLVFGAGVTFGGNGAAVTYDVNGKQTNSMGAAFGERIAW